MNTRVKCAACKSYFNKEDAVWQNALQRICSSKCLSDYLDRKKPKPRQVHARRKAEAAGRVQASLPIKLRLEIRQRDHHRCRWCGRPGQQVHHIHYRSEGGPDEPSNLILLCTPCHGRAHSSKAAFKPLLLACVWMVYVDKRNVLIPDVARHLDRLGLLTVLQQERLAG